MSEHAVRRGSRLRSPRLRALLGLGLVSVLGATGTFAAWTDNAVVTGTTFTSGTIDLRVDNQDSLPAYTSLNLATMVPGNSTAAVLTIKNNGTAPLKYTAVSTAGQLRRQGPRRRAGRQGHGGHGPGGRTVSHLLGRHAHRHRDHARHQPGHHRPVAPARQRPRRCVSR